MEALFIISFVGLCIGVYFLITLPTTCKVQSNKINDAFLFGDWIEDESIYNN